MLAKMRTVRTIVCVVNITVATMAESRIPVFRVRKGSEENGVRYRWLRFNLEKLTKQIQPESQV